MEQFILDLGSDANVLPKKTWERMGILALQWSPVQFRMVNLQKIIPTGQLYEVTIDIEGVSVIFDFEVIEIINDSNPYPTLLGIDCAIDMNGVINLKKRIMSFEWKSHRFVVPLDPAEGVCYTEPVHDYEESEDELDSIYKIIARNWYQINPMVDDRITWDCESSYISDLDEELEHWQNRLHEVSTL